MTKAKPDLRVNAAKALAEVFSGNQSLSTALPKFSESLSVKDQALMQELCFGICREAEPLKYISSQLIKKPLKAKDQDIQMLVYLGIYQLLHTRIPDHAAIAATVDASKKLKKQWASGLLNGLLRNVQRASEEQKQQWQQANDCCRFKHPKWLLKQLQSAWPEYWQDIAKGNNQRAPMTLRVNSLKITRDEYLNTLRDHGFASNATCHSPYGIQLEQPLPVDALPNFAEGFASVQDEAAQLSAHLLEAKAGDRVLDACCAPGGKTCHILELEPDISELIAVDLEAARMERVKENLNRLGLKATIKVADALETGTWWDGEAFERILLDAPCSATGVIRRHPDIKLLRRNEDIAELARLQLRMLKSLWLCLKPGGRLLYATCSIFPQENSDNVKAFISDTADAVHQRIDADWGEEQEFGRQLFPGQSNHDGFYYAVLEKQLAPGGSGLRP